MPSVMLRKNGDGALLFYVAKKDQEDVVASVEVDDETSWGGVVTLSDGSEYYIKPVSPPPTFPTTLRFKRNDASAA
ncbi:MAG: putative nitrogen fixation protein NifT [Pseudomonadota bacterium]